MWKLKILVISKICRPYIFIDGLYHEGISGAAEEDTDYRRSIGKL